MSETDTGAESGRSGTFSISPREQPSRPQVGRNVRTRRAERQLVLIVEDEEPIADALAMVVEDAGYLPITAAHGQQALEIARARHPALVITDLMMPYMDGHELIRALRTDVARDGLRPPPIILMTAAGPRQATAAGADAILYKPFNISQVEALLKRFLGPPLPRDTSPSDDNASGAGSP